MTMTTNTSLAPIAASVTFRVVDFAAWKKGFDSHEQVRRQAGILGLQINRGTDDPGLVCVFSHATDRDKLQAFLTSDDLKAREREAGVLGPPSIELLVPQEDQAVRGKTLASTVALFEVESYDRWKAAFDAGRELRTRAGIIGHAINRSATNPNRVCVYLQAETAAQLRALHGSAELAASMKKCGVIMPPQIHYLTETAVAQ
jgi:quinol monooxygenase YgiN